MRDSSAPRQPDHWLRGPVAGIPALLQPVAHALLQCLDDLEGAVSALSGSELDLKPGGAASIAFHLRHLAGSTDRLFTYACGDELDDEQRRMLAEEKVDPESPIPASVLLAEVRRVFEKALAQLESTSEDALLDPRPVGRARLPANVLGLLFHAAEHAQRHTGQVVTTAKIVRGMGVV